MALFFVTEIYSFFCVDVKTRWKSLRDKYVRLDKVEETPTWEYWEDLSFLKRHINHKKNFKNSMHESSPNSGSAIPLSSTSVAIPSAKQSTTIMQSSSDYNNFDQGSGNLTDKSIINTSPSMSSNHNDSIVTSVLDQQRRFRAFNPSGQVLKETNKTPPYTSLFVSSNSDVEEPTNFLQSSAGKLTNQELDRLENLEFPVTSDNSNTIVFDKFLDSSFQKSFTEQLSDQRLVLDENVEVINLEQCQSDNEFYNDSENEFQYLSRIPPGGVKSSIGISNSSTFKDDSISRPQNSFEKKLTDKHSRTTSRQTAELQNLLNLRQSCLNPSTSNYDAFTSIDSLNSGFLKSFGKELLNNNCRSSRDVELNDIGQKQMDSQYSSKNSHLKNKNCNHKVNNTTLQTKEKEAQKRKITNKNKVDQSPFNNFPIKGKSIVDGNLTLAKGESSFIDQVVKVRTDRKKVVPSPDKFAKRKKTSTSVTEFEKEITNCSKNMSQMTTNFNELISLKRQEIISRKNPKSPVEKAYNPLIESDDGYFNLIQIEFLKLTSEEQTKTFKDILTVFNRNFT